MNHFCDGLKRAETDDDKFALASHIISTAMDLKGTYWFLFFMYVLYGLTESVRQVKLGTWPISGLSGWSLSQFL